MGRSHARAGHALDRALPRGSDAALHEGLDAPLNRTYWAFISYSHQDRAWAEWLHRALETYRVPRRLVGTPGADGPIPRRLIPVFRDRDELASSADLGARITTALAESRCLIVVCSPRAAASRWVNEEITTFKAQGRADRLLCLIVDGEPDACFPEAIRTAPVEPIAADARPGGDGKDAARIKLIAGMLGVPYDELRQRERQRQRWRRVRATAAAVAVAATVFGVWQWQEVRKATLERQERVERYTDQGRQELLQGNAARALAYLSEAYALGGDRAALRFLVNQAALALPAESPDRHAKGVYTARFSPDGTRLLTASLDATAKIWDAATGRVVFTLAHKNEVNSAVFSPDGTRVATGSDDHTVKIWDARTGELLKSLEEHRDKVYVVAFDARGTRLATASEDGTARIWDAVTYLPVTPPLIHDKSVVAVSFSRDGRSLLTASDDRTAAVWDTARGRKIASLPLHGSGLRDATFSPDGTRIASVARDGEGRLWTRDGALVATLIGHRDQARRVVWSPDGARIVTVSGDATARVWDGTTGRFLFALLGHARRQQVYAVAYRGDGRVIATAGADGTVKLWDAAGGRLLSTLERHRDRVYGVEFSRDGRVLSSAGEDGDVLVWDVADPNAPRLAVELGGKTSGGVFDDRLGALRPSPSLVHTLADHAGYVTVARFSADGARVVTVASGRPRVWSAAGVLLTTLDTAVTDASLDRDGGRLVTGNAGGAVAVWDAARGGSPLTTVDAFHGPVRSVQFTKDGRRIVAAGEDKTFGVDGKEQTAAEVKVFDAAGGAPLIRMPGSAPVFSDDGRSVALLAGASTHKVWDPGGKGAMVELWWKGRSDASVWSAEGTLLATLEGHLQTVFSARLSADGTRAVTASEDQTAAVWDVASRKRLATLSGHIDFVRFAAFSPDGRTVVTTSKDKTAKLWDARTGRPLASLAGDQNYVASAAFSPDGTLLATQSVDPHVKIWDAVTGRLLARLDGHVAAVTSIAFSPDGRWLLTAGQDGTARLWNLGYEMRPAAEVAQFTRERVSWRVEEGRLVSGPPVRP